MVSILIAVLRSKGVDLAFIIKRHNKNKINNNKKSQFVCSQSLRGDKLLSYWIHAMVPLTNMLYKIYSPNDGEILNIICSRGPKNRLNNICSRDKNSAEPSVMKSTSLIHLNCTMHSRGPKY